ncbi:unnamed protein product [Lupinus luteus]|uniref:LCR n=1 Tax=Lupinus luteus TaxID=3873 RepID=A0AAV1W047_LUPLU
MACGTYQHFLIGILCIALILTSGPRIVKASEHLQCTVPCIGGKDRENIICNKNCIDQGYEKGGLCSESKCCCKVSIG